MYSERMRVLQIGNFTPPHSTENHLKRALTNNGHQVTEVQENQPAIWKDLARVDNAFMKDQDFVLWTRTGWDYSRLEYTGDAEAQDWQQGFIACAHAHGLPVVSYHLDLFFGLNPERVAITDEPFFKTDLVVTADGGHQELFEAKDVNHVWFPPGVSEGECQPGMFRDEFRSPIAFVGNWAGEYHPESKHRFELVRWLQEHYMRDCAFWPQRGHHAIRGADLRDLYASVDVVVGDSCFAGQIENYWSDRIPETLGRGGYLLHPDIPGLGSQFDTTEDLATWPAGNWDELGARIDKALASPTRRREVAAHGRQTVLAKHTYEVRMKQLLGVMASHRLIALDAEPAPAPQPVKKVAAKKAAPRKKAAPK